MNSFFWNKSRNIPHLTITTFTNNHETWFQSQERSFINLNQTKFHIKQTCRSEGIRRPSTVSGSFLHQKKQPFDCSRTTCTHNRTQANHLLSFEAVLHLFANSTDHLYRLHVDRTAPTLSQSYKESPKRHSATVLLRFVIIPSDILGKTHRFTENRANNMAATHDVM